MQLQHRTLTYFIREGIRHVYRNLWRIPNRMDRENDLGI